MVVKIIESEHLQLGNIEAKIAGGKIYAWEISCSYQGKIDMTALSLCCRKLDREKVQSILFQGIESSLKVRKIFDRELRSAEYEIEDNKPKMVEMSVDELRKFEAWKKSLHQLQEEISTPVISGEVKKDPDFKMRSKTTPPQNFLQIADQDGIEIEPRSLWIYDGSICTSEFSHLTVRDVTKKGISFMEPMKLPFYSKEHFGSNSPFKRFKK